MAAPAYAGTLTWDGGGSGTWDTTLTNWYNGTTNVAWTNSGTTNTALFGGTDGTYSIVVSGITRTDGITFNSSGYTLSAASTQSINVAGTGILSIASGKTATIGNNIDLFRGSSWTVSGGGTVNVNSGSQVRASGSGISISLNSTTANLNGGFFGVQTSGGGNLIIGNSNSGTTVLNISSGTARGGNSSNYGVRFAGSGITNSVATINLDGGTMETSRIYAVAGAGNSSTFNFNGGTLKVTGTPTSGDFMTGLTAANVKEGGALVDTGGFDVTISQVLLHGGVAAKDGGLTKSNTGVLTLSAVNTYTGDTTVSAGTLLLADNAGMKFVIGANGVNNKVVGTGTLTLDGDFTFDLTAAGTTVGNSWNIVNVATLSETFSSTFSVVGFTETANVWSRNVSGTQYEFSEATGVLSVVPEPGTYALLAFGGVMLMVFRRRLRRA